MLFRSPHQIDLAVDPSPSQEAASRGGRRRRPDMCSIHFFPSLAATGYHSLAAHPLLSLPIRSISPAPPKKQQQRWKWSASIWTRHREFPVSLLSASKPRFHLLMPLPVPLQIRRRRSSPASPSSCCSSPNKGREELVQSDPDAQGLHCIRLH